MGENSSSSGHDTRLPTYTELVDGPQRESPCMESDGVPERSWGLASVVLSGVIRVQDGGLRTRASRVADSKGRAD